MRMFTALTVLLTVFASALVADLAPARANEEAKGEEVKAEAAKTAVKPPQAQLEALSHDARVALLPADLEAGLNRSTLDREDLVCLALNDYHEARAETLEGRLAVAQVVLNRVTSKAYPNSVCGVVRQGFRKGRRDCQFSWYCDGKTDFPYETKAWRKSIALAKAVTRPGGLRDRSQGALWYHADYVKPAWADAYHVAAVLGAHIFYRKTPVWAPETPAPTQTYQVARNKR